MLRQPWVLRITFVFTLVFGFITAQEIAIADQSKDIQQIPLPEIKLKQIFKGISLHNIVLMLQSPGDTRYWYVLEKAGRVLQLDNDNPAQEATVVLDISERVNSQPIEAGLLGMAFDPQYLTNHAVYLSYTGGASDLVSTISRFTLAKDGGGFDPQSEQILLQLTQPYSNHNGGNIAFGPDGYLYIGFGDGGSGGDPDSNGQNVKTLLGTLLRIDPKNNPYAIPADNPFADGRKGRPEIYAWGLRNPWRWSFDTATGVLWLGDVGQNSWEEVDRVTQPGNFGWNRKEGSHCYKSSTCVQPDVVDPVIEYSHDEGCSITGGYVYRGTKIPDLQGVYLYADYCSGTIWGARLNGESVTKPHRLIKSGLNIASFAQANDGELFVLHYGGAIYQISP